MINQSPSCKCAQCVLNPTASHGIEMICVFVPAHVATMRGRTPLNVAASVQYTWGNGLRGMKTEPAV